MNERQKQELRIKSVVAANNSELVYNEIFCTNANVVSSKISCLENEIK